MNYLRISNAGLICAEDLTLIGSSTKREQSGKIGMFGSGWKYALSWLIRNDCSPRIFSGKNEITIDCTVRLHRDNPVQVITVNGIETSLTTQMGPKWNGWMALREVISNAIDEGGNALNSVWMPEFSGVEGETVIYIPMNVELSEVMMKYDRYFSFNRKANYESKYGRIFVKKEESEMNVYRKGIRCFDTQSVSILDFDLFDVDINEDRIANEYGIRAEVRNIVNENEDPILLKMIINEGVGYLPYSINDKTLICIKSLINQGETFITSTLIKMGGMLFSSPDSLIIPSDWYKTLTDLGLIANPFEMLDNNVPFMRTDSKDCSGIAYYLKGFNLNMPIQSGACEPDVFFKAGTAYVKQDSKLDDKSLACAILARMKANDWAWFLK